MQHGVLPHILLPIKHLLNQQFGDRIMSRHFLLPWPPRSLDLTTTDFWLWGYVKSKVHKFYPQIVSHLKDTIRTAIQEIPIAIIRVEVLSTICRMKSVIVCEGGLVENF